MSDLYIIRPQYGKYTDNTVGKEAIYIIVYT